MIAAGGIQHRRQRQASRRRDSAGKYPIEPGARAAPGDLVLAVVGGLVDADGCAHRLTFGADDAQRPPSGDRSASPSARTPGGANHSACSRPKFAPITAPAAINSIVDRRAAHRPRRRQLLVGIGQAEAARSNSRAPSARCTSAWRKRRSARRPSRGCPGRDRPAPSSATARGRCRRPG